MSLGDGGGGGGAQCAWVVDQGCGGLWVTARPPG